jgi:hypothetical protein
VASAETPGRVGKRSANRAPATGRKRSRRVTGRSCGVQKLASLLQIGDFSPSEPSRHLNRVLAPFKGHAAAARALAADLVGERADVEVLICDALVGLGRVLPFALLDAYRWQLCFACGPRLRSASPSKSAAARRFGSVSKAAETHHDEPPAAALGADIEKCPVDKGLRASQRGPRIARFAVRFCGSTRFAPGLGSDPAAVSGATTGVGARRRAGPPVEPARHLECRR